MMKQGKIPSTWITTRADPSDSDDLYSESEDLREPELASQWTRVKSVVAMKSLAVQLFDIEKDIQSDLTTTRARQHISGDRGVCIFDPQAAEGRLQSYQLGNHRLSPEELKLYAEMVTTVRARFAVDERQLTDISMDNCSVQALDEIKRKVKLNRGQARMLQPVDPLPLWNGFESGQRKSRHGLLRRCQLRAADLLAICSFWRAHQPTMSDLASTFKITRALAQNLIWQYKRDPEMLARRYCKEEVHGEKLALIRGTVQDMIDTKKQVWSVGCVQAALGEASPKPVKKHLINTVLRTDFDMSYRKLVHTSYLANNPRSLVLRQQYAKIMIPLLLEGKRVINIDESSVPFMDYRRAKWAKRGTKNTFARKELTPKVNMIAALDTGGRVYVSLT